MVRSRVIPSVGEGGCLSGEGCRWEDDSFLYEISKGLGYRRLGPYRSTGGAGGVEHHAALVDIGIIYRDSLYALVSL